MEAEKLKIDLGLSLLMAALGGIEGYLLFNSLQGMALGACMGIVISWLTLLGLIPFVGALFYSYVVTSLLSHIGVEFTLLYMVGLVVSVVLTAIMTLLAIIWIVSEIKG